jgi:predicted nucleic acid-binding protein
MKLRVYLDTSVFSAYYDERTPERMAETRLFWGRLAGMDAMTSDMARQELLRVRDASRRIALLQLLDGASVQPVTDGIRRVAETYVAAGLFVAERDEDAIHVAAAVVHDADVLVSWNFRHLVNRRQRAAIGEITDRLGMTMPEILAPPEV